MRAFALALWVLLAPGAFADDVDKLHSRLLQRGDLQFQFAAAEQELPRAPNWLSALLNAISPVFSLIFWGAAAIAVGALLFYIARESWTARYGRDEKKAKLAPIQQTAYQPDASTARTLLEDADRLAGEGRFDEAVHVLLHRSIEDIEQRSPRSIRKAQTSREIAGLSVLPEAARSAFAPLIRAVEQSWFGGRSLDAAGYQVCRKAYAEFALPEAWS